jgi:sugar (pentulose or hexulose) kinase
VNEWLLGIDVGTSYVKAGVVTTDGVERAHGRVRTPWRSVPTGAEVDPQMLVEAATTAAHHALAGVPRGRVIALGVTGMAETGVLLDAAGRPLMPAIAWHDTRGTVEASALARSFGDEFSARTGLPPSTQWSVVKLRWLRAHCPEASLAVRWLNIPEWVVRCLGGAEVAELSLASRTGFLDIKRSDWWDETLGWLDAPPGFLPELTDASSPAGQVTRVLDAAKGAVLAVAGHDHLCASVGAGATGPGDVFDSCGTAEALVRSLNEIPPRGDVLRLVRDGITVGRHVLPDRFAMLGGLESGLARQRFLTMLGVESEEQRHALDMAALALGPGPAGLIVHSVNDALASVSGIFHGARPAHLWRATLEAVEGQSTNLRAKLESYAGETERLVVSGGGARSAGVRALKKAAAGAFDEPPVTEAGVRGAALIAGRAAGLYLSLFEVPLPRATVEAQTTSEEGSA